MLTQLFELFGGDASIILIKRISVFLGGGIEVAVRLIFTSRF